MNSYVWQYALTWDCNKDLQYFNMQDRAQKQSNVQKYNHKAKILVQSHYQSL